MLDLAGQVEIFSGEVLQKEEQINIGWHWKKLKTAKEIILKKYRIEEICFTSMAIIGGKLFSNNPKNMNHVDKYTDYLLYVIITLVKI